MPLVSRFFSVAFAGSRSRFASKDARFRLAVASGFVAASVAVVTIAADRPGFAQSVMWGASSVFGDQSFFQQSAAPALAPTQTSGRPFARRRTARRGGGETLHAVRAVRYIPRHARERQAPMDLARKSICVRLCDGFAFPVGVYHGEQDRASHEATCQSECPGAETALYLVPAGSDALGDAVRVGSGRDYSQLPEAFHYTTVLSDSCSCHPKSGGRIASLLHDFTLRRGDAVMTARGFQVFHGGARYPFKRTDFVALAKSHDVRGSDRAAFQRIERASLTTTGETRVAENGVATHPEHRASR